MLHAIKCSKTIVLTQNWKGLLVHYFSPFLNVSIALLHILVLYIISDCMSNTESFSFFFFFLFMLEIGETFKLFQINCTVCVSYM